MHTYTNRGDAKAAAERLFETAREIREDVDEFIRDNGGICAPERAADVEGAEALRVEKLWDGVALLGNLPPALTCRDCGETNDDVREDRELREGTPLCGECCTKSIGEHYPEDWRK